MRLGLWLSAAVVVAGCARSALTPLDREAEIAALRALQYEWAAAYVALDTARVGRLLADDYFVVTGETRGDNADRPRAINAILRHNPDRPIYAYDQEQMEIRIYGITGVITAISRLRMRDRESGEDIEHASRYVHVWVKRNGEWKLVSRQATTLPRGSGGPE